MSRREASRRLNVNVCFRTCAISREESLQRVRFNFAGLEDDIGLVCLDSLQKQAGGSPLNVFNAHGGSRAPCSLLLPGTAARDSPTHAARRRGQARTLTYVDVILRDCGAPDQARGAKFLETLAEKKMI